MFRNINILLLGYITAANHVERLSLHKV